MSKFIKNLSLFFAGLPLLLSKASNASTAPNRDLVLDPSDDQKAVPLRPLNFDINNLFAGHRSHSSHSSHSSHYSGSTGSSYTPPPSVTTSTPASSAPDTSGKSPNSTSTPYSPADASSKTLSPTPPSSGNSGSNGTNSGLSNSDPKASSVSTRPRSNGGSNADKLMLQILRVQIKLNSLQLYDGQINGIMNKETQKSLRQYQAVKGLSVTGTMTTETMNALGIAI